MLRKPGSRSRVPRKSRAHAGGGQTELATVFDLPMDSVRVVSLFVGGGFGSGLRCRPHTVVAAMAARETGRRSNWS